jgi:hypothetical protein
MKAASEPHFDPPDLPGLCERELLGIIWRRTDEKRSTGSRAIGG